jgi:hypothetical protein
MMRLILLALLLSTSSALAQEDNDEGGGAVVDAYNLLGWTRDGASLVYTVTEGNGFEREEDGPAPAQLAVVIDAATGALRQYSIDPADKKKQKDAFDAWLKANPVACTSGRRSADGKSRVDIKVRPKGFSGEWSDGKYSIGGDDPPAEAFEASVNVSRDGKAWPKQTMTGRVAFYGQGQGCDVSLCWSPDGTRLAWIVHTGRTMRDPAAYDLHVSASDGTFDPDAKRTQAVQAAMKAKRANVVGMKAYRAKNYALATKKFRDAIAADVSFVTAHYNLACVAALQNDKQTAIAELKWLAASADPQAKAKLKKAATDPDLRSLAGDAEAKALLGQ